MKTAIFKYSLLAGAMVFSGLAMANTPSATLLVKGQVSTGTCTAVVNTPNINLGTTSTDKLPATGGYQVKSKVGTLLNINCTSPLKYQISITDNRNDSAVLATDVGLDGSFNSAMLGLGTIDGKKIGGYTVGAYLVHSAVNGSTVISPSRIRKSITPGAEWITIDDSGQGGIYAAYAMTPLNYTTGTPRGTSYVAIANAGEDEPVATTAASIEFRSDFYLSSELTSITDQAQIDGSVTFNLDYL